MRQLDKVHEYEFLYGNRIATAFVLSNGVKIIGFVHGNLFDLRVLTVGFNPKGKGLGQDALRFLRPKFKKIIVNEIYEHALPFWVKMRERGLVDRLESVKDGESLYHVNETSNNEQPVGRLTIVNSVGIVNIKLNPALTKVPEAAGPDSDTFYNAHSPPDPELDFVCGI